MNNSNKNLLKWIKVFFKTIYIILIVFTVLTLLSQLLSTFLSEDHFGSFPVLLTIDNPGISVNIGNKLMTPDTIAGIGGVMIHNVPLSLNIITSLLTLTTFVIFILIIRCIRRIIKSIKENEVFSLINAKRLMTIGYLLVLNLIINYSAIIIYTSHLHTLQSSNKGYAFGLIVGDSMGYIISIVFTFFIAAIFKIGVNMQEENKSFV